MNLPKVEFIHKLLQLGHFLCDLIQVGLFWVFGELFEVTLVVIEKVSEAIFVSQGCKEISEEPVHLLNPLAAIKFITRRVLK